ncbi:MAG: TetR/AcrR family transcriptional regulator [Candidatus Dormibacteria bacterium]
MDTVTVKRTGARESPRVYRQVARAERLAGTRQRIVEATYQLHATVGPNRTTVAEIARRAGVQRLTVYRHFPDERSLFAACSGHSRTLNPPPAADLGADAQGVERARQILLGMFRYYGFNPRLVDNLMRDSGAGPAAETVRAAMTPMRAAISDAEDRIVAAVPHGERAASAVRAAAHHAMAFSTWRSLVMEGGIDDERAAGLLVAMIEAAAA